MLSGGLFPGTFQEGGEGKTPPDLTGPPCFVFALELGLPSTSSDPAPVGMSTPLGVLWPLWGRSLEYLARELWPEKWRKT